MDIKTLRWLVLNGFFFCMLWLGLFRGIEGAANVAIFIVWFCAFGAMAGPERFTQAFRKKGGPSVSRWLDGGFDVLVIVMLVWQGWFISGAAYLIHFVVVQQAFDLFLTQEASGQEASGSGEA